MTVSSRRRRSAPWLHRQSRLITTVIAAAGVLLTAYLTITKLTGNHAACPTDGCDRVLNSAYATVFGLPLSLYGGLAYLVVLGLALAPRFVPIDRKEQRTKIESQTGFLLLILGTAMAVFSSYLVYLLLTEIHAFCPYCWTSALFSMTLFGLGLFGQPWDDLGRPLFTVAIVMLVTLTGVFGLYGYTNATNANTNTQKSSPALTGNAPPPVTTESGPAELALAEYLSQNGVKEYGAFWCPHCYDQKQLFGRAAAAKLNYIECDPRGQNAQTEQCQKAGVNSFPTWEVGGKLVPGVQPLEKLADLSGYRGARNFRYSGPSGR